MKIKTLINLWLKRPEWQRAVIYILFGVVTALALTASTARAADFGLNYSLAFVPPHHEPVVGDKVARYRVQAEPSVSTDWIDYRLQVNAWLVNTWQSSDSQASESWKDDDWGVEDVRYSLLHRVEVGPWKYARLFAEYYIPINPIAWGGHGMERHYYLLTGVSGSLF